MKTNIRRKTTLEYKPMWQRDPGCLKKSQEHQHNCRILEPEILSDPVRIILMINKSIVCFVRITFLHS